MPNRNTRCARLQVRAFVGAMCLVWFGGCTSVVTIPSSNQSSRVDYVVIHATSENFAESMRLLTTVTDYPVSSHYLIPRADDPSYPRRRARLYQFVEEHARAWHAGVSYWAGETGLNDRSIGIEIVNEFACSGDDRKAAQTLPSGIACTFVPYTQTQIDLLIALLRDIQRRYPDIDPVDFVAHSDIAPMRKSDPGPLFPWRVLFEAGIGAWFDESQTAALTDVFAQAMPDVNQVQRALNAYGYEVDVTGLMDRQTRFALRALQLHYRARDFDGELDAQTVAILWNLLQRYRPDRYRELDLGSALR